jgi:hypothetical protein
LVKYRFILEFGGENYHIKVIRYTETVGEMISPSEVADHTTGEVFWE